MPIFVLDKIWIIMFFGQLIFFQIFVNFDQYWKFYTVTNRINKDFLKIDFKNFWSIRNKNNSYKNLKSPYKCQLSD
jgi:hypothetical protein